MVARVKGQETQVTPNRLSPSVSTRLPELQKISAGREPAAQRPAREFFLAEVLVGAAIALIIYLILSRPVEFPPPPKPADSTVATTPAGAEAQPESAAKKGSAE